MQALIIYRLIDAAIIGKLFHDPFLFKIGSIYQILLLDNAMQQRVNFINNIIIVMLDDSENLRSYF